MRPLLLFLLCVLLPRLVAAPQPAPKPERPKLVLAVMVDQLRWDYLVRFRGQFKGGLKRLLEQGAVYTNAHLEHYPTVTAIGHSTFLSGAKPSVSGIVGNDWYERETGANVTSVFDPAVQPIGGISGKSASPRRLLVSTLGDELKMAGRGSKVIGISLKDRGAILPAGHMADYAFWYQQGKFVSSTYYAQDLPQWAKQFNESGWINQFAGKQWLPLAGGAPLLAFPAMGAELVKAVSGSFAGNDLIEAFAEAAVKNEKLGQRDSTDVLAVALSSNDVVGHAKGPDSAEVADITVRTDETLGRLFDFLDRTVGMKNVVVVLSADHGVAPVPEVNTGRKMPGGRIKGPELFDMIDNALDRAFGAGKWVVGTAGTAPYLDWKLIEGKSFTREQVLEVASRAAYQVPHVLRVLTGEQLMKGQTPPDRFSRRVAESYFPTRSGDLEILIDPYWLRSASGTTHGSPWLYDSHIPLILMGPGIKPGIQHRHVALNDVAPTLATLLEVETPSGSAGEVLLEALQ